MRKIKFRVWDTRDKKMSVSFTLEEFANDQDGEMGNGDFSLKNYCPESENILMQYTGIKDKNGKEIYDGDIVRSIQDWDHSIEQVSAVKQITPVEWMWGCYGNINIALKYHKNTEVIGNIYENPELLENENID
jgi:hypothetical protein